MHVFAVRMFTLSFQEAEPIHRSKGCGYLFVTGPQHSPVVRAPG